MQKKILVIILVLTMIIPVIDLKPVYAFSQQWETVADVTPGTNDMSITAIGPTGSINVSASKGIIKAPQGSFVINTSKYTTQRRKDGVDITGCSADQIISQGAFDPTNYQYAILFYGYDYRYMSGDTQYGCEFGLSPSDSNFMNVISGNSDEILVKEFVEPCYRLNNGLTFYSQPVSTIWNNTSRSDAALAVKFGNYTKNARIKIIRRLWPKNPKLTVTTPINQALTTSMVFSGAVSDSNIGDALTTYYSIDGGAQVSIGSITTDLNTAGKDISFTNIPISVGDLSEGNHVLTAWTSDSSGLKSNNVTVPFRVDKSAPTITDCTLTSDSTSLSATIQANDLVAGLTATPYRFTVSSFGPSSWLASGVYTQGGLNSNKEYAVTCEVTDPLGHIATANKSIWTKAQKPVIISDQYSSTTFRAVITDNNPEDTKYQIIANDASYVTPEGTLTTSPVWISLVPNSEGKIITIKGLSPLTGYSIKVKAKNGESIETAWSLPTTATTLCAPPNPPSSITSISTDTTITTKWDPVPGATGYEVELDGKTIDVGQAAQYSALKLNPGTPHTFKVRARNAGGSGEWSEVITKSTLPAKPTVPANLSVLPLSNMITLTWNNVPGATGYDVDVDDVVTSIGPNTSYKHTSLASGTLHKYRVRSINAGDKSEWSGYVAATTTLDSGTVPAGLTAVTTQSAITLNWEPVANATGYDVEVDGIALDNGNKTSYTHTSPTVGIEHKYRVKSKKGSILSDWSALVTAKLAAETFGTPVVTEDVQDTSITLSWKPVKDANGYEVEVDGIIQNNGLDTAFVHDGLSPQKSHTYRVRAKGVAGDSSWSELKTLTTAVLATPTNLVTTSSALSIQLTWNPVQGATGYDVDFDGVQFNDLEGTTFTKDGLSQGTSHSIKIRSKNALGVSSWSNLKRAQTLSGAEGNIELSCLAKKTSIMLLWPEQVGATAYEIEADGKIVGTTKDQFFAQTSLEAGSKHAYRVRIVGTKEWSKLLNTLTLAEKPAVPSNVVASGTMTTIQISWDSVVAAKSYDVEVDGVIVENGEGTTYLSSKLAPGQEHKFRVRAINLNGASEWSSLLTKSTLSSSKKFELSSAAGDEFNLVLSGANIQDLKGYTFTVTYNPEELEVTDLCGFTSRVDMGTGSITGTDLSVTQFVPGTLVFKKSGSAELNELWSSAVNSIKFTAKKAGNTSISYTIN